MLQCGHIPAQAKRAGHSDRHTTAALGDSDNGCRRYNSQSQIVCECSFADHVYVRTYVYYCARHTLDSRIVAGPDEHETVYDLDALYEQFAHDAAAKSLAASSTTRVLWSGTDIVGQPYARVQLNDLLCDDAVARSVVASLVRYGLAFIERVPANLHSTEVAVKRMFEPHKTLFGEMWSLSDNALHADSAYTREFLGAHTDNTYFNDAAGLQVLHCVQHCGTGGESLLVDGFRALTALRDRDAGAYDRLRTVDVPAEYVEKGQHHKYVAPIVRHTPGVVDGQLEQIR